MASWTALSGECRGDERVSAENVGRGCKQPRQHAIDKWLPHTGRGAENQQTNCFLGSTSARRFDSKVEPRTSRPSPQVSSRLRRGLPDTNYALRVRRRPTRSHGHINHFATRLCRCRPPVRLPPKVEARRLTHPFVITFLSTSRPSGVCT